MSDKKINERILKGIEESCKGDKKVAMFLIDILYNEVEHAGQWRWKEVYRKKIKEYSENWGGDYYED